MSFKWDATMRPILWLHWVDKMGPRREEREDGLEEGTTERTTS